LLLLLVLGESAITYLNLELVKVVGFAAVQTQVVEVAADSCPGTAA